MLLYWKVLLPSTSISPVSSTILLVFLYCWSLNSAELGALPPCTVKNVHLTWTSPKLNYSCPLVSLRDWFQDPMWCQYPGVLKGIIWNAIEQCIQLALCFCRFPAMDWKYCFQSVVGWICWYETQGYGGPPVYVLGKPACKWTSVVHNHVVIWHRHFYFLFFFPESDLLLWTLWWISYHCYHFVQICFICIIFFMALIPKINIIYYRLDNWFCFFSILKHSKYLSIPFIKCSVDLHCISSERVSPSRVSACLQPLIISVSPVLGPSDYVEHRSLIQPPLAVNHQWSAWCASFPLRVLFPPSCCSPGLLHSWTCTCPLNASWNVFSETSVNSCQANKVHCSSFCFQ